MLSDKSFLKTFLFVLTLANFIAYIGISKIEISKSIRSINDHSKSLVFEYERGNFPYTKLELKGLKDTFLRCAGLYDSLGNFLLGDKKCSHSTTLFNLNGEEVLEVHYSQKSLVPISLYINKYISSIIIINLICLLIGSHNLVQNTQQKREKLHFEEIKNIQKQVAHDIESPLMALRSAIENIDDKSDINYKLIHLASKRIEEISKNLSLVYNEKKRLHENHSLPILLEEIVCEKKYVFLKYPNLEIKLSYEGNPYSCFIDISKSEFQRVLSNLINNAAEAIDLKGTIDIKVVIADDVEISICDKGIGISSEMISKIFDSGFSTKIQGNVLGLAHAKNTIEKFQGKIHIHSIPNKGSTVTISLPKIVK